MPARAETVAVLRASTRLTARVSTFDAPVDQSVRFGTLVITVRACVKHPPEEPPETAAFLDIDEAAPAAARPPKSKRVFSGWMFASSPAVSAMEDPIYDVNVLDCKSDATAAPSSGSEREIGAAPPARGRAAGDRPRARSRWRRSARDGSVTNWVSSSRKPPIRSRATRWASATLLASVMRLNMLSPKNARAQRHAVEPAHQLAVVAHLDAVGEALAVERGIEPRDLVVDPGLGAIRRRLGAAADDGVEIADRSATSKRPPRSVRRSRRGRWKRSSGSTPRRSGSTQNSSGSSADSAIGKMPAA